MGILDSVNNSDVGFFLHCVMEKHIITGECQVFLSSSFLVITVLVSGLNRCSSLTCPVEKSEGAGKERKEPGKDIDHPPRTFKVVGFCF